MTQQIAPKPTDAPTAARPARMPRAGWVSFGLCIAGVLISAYLTFEHYTASATLACSENAAVNCLKVTTGPWSQIAGIPTAVAGLAFFLAMTVLCAPTRWARQFGVLRLVGVVAGIVMVLWLIYVELLIVDAICLWCTGVHLITVLLLGTVLWWRESTRA